MAAAALQYLEKICSDTDQTDVILAAATPEGTEDIPCHVLIISRSEVLKNTIAEGRFKEGDLKRIDIQIGNAKHVKAMKEILYMDRMSDVANWKPNDLVFVMALCDKYEVTWGVEYISRELGRRSHDMKLAQFEQLVEEVSVSVGPKASVSFANGLVSELEFGVNATLVLLSILRLQQVQNVSMKAQVEACIDTVTVSKEEMQKELAKVRGSHDKQCVSQAVMLIFGKYALKMGGWAFDFSEDLLKSVQADVFSGLQR